jgi:hypothetical protein
MPFPEGGDQMRYRTLITIGAIVAACGALGGAPALASQSSAPHQAVAAATHPRHAVLIPHTARTGGLQAGCNVMNCFLETVSGFCYARDGVHCTPFLTPIVGTVNPPNCWPFNPDCRFNTLSGYEGSEVLQFVDHDFGYCLRTDSVHSLVTDNSACVPHDAGTYWVTVGGSGSPGNCAGHPIFWLVNVGMTNHYDPYPYGEAMFLNTDGNFYVQSHRPIGGDDQFCTLPQS